MMADEASLILATPDTKLRRQSAYDHCDEQHGASSPPPSFSIRREPMRPCPSAPPPEPCQAPLRRTAVLADDTAEAGHDAPSAEDRSDTNDMSLATMSIEDHCSLRLDDSISIRSPHSNRTLEEQRQQQQEEDSIALARQLMEQEAMQAHAASADFLRYNAADFSQEDYEALQAALAEEEHVSDEERSDDEPDLTYDMMLRLGDTLGDVKQERWTWVAQSEIDKLETLKFDSEAVRDKDENDPQVKCLVCQFRYEADDELRRLPCGHCFHSECVDQWLREKDLCPYCRKTIVDGEES